MTDVISRAVVTVGIVVLSDSRGAGVGVGKDGKSLKELSTQGALERNEWLQENFRLIEGSALKSVGRGDKD